MKASALCLGALTGLLVPLAAGAFSLKTGASASCHEKITSRAVVELLSRFELPPGVPIPESDAWERISQALIDEQHLDDTYPQIAEPDNRLVLLSMIIGVRAPDTEGHSVFNLEGLRRLHADPEAAGQYAHALRAPADNGEEGNVAAVAGTRRTILALMVDAREALRRPSPDQIITAHIYLDFYGEVPVEVWGPAYHLGRAVHAVQDSFAHTLRDEDLKRITHVMNYVEAISGDLRESRDGLAHSETMDSCEKDGENQEIVETAGLASADLVIAGGMELMGGGGTQMEAYLDRWITLQPGCNMDNDYCGSRWLSFAREEQTGPYLDEIFGCYARPGAAGWSPLVLLLLGWVLLVRRWRAGVLALLVMAAPSAGEAACVDREAFVQLEGHASVLNDAPSRSLLSSTFGAGLRGGYRWGRLAAIVHVERNWWVPTEIDVKVEPGALNMGLGGELRYAGGMARTSLVLGPSVLLFDTALDEAGEVGVFFDLRPLGLRFELGELFALALDPLSFALVAPVLGDIPIVQQEYRTLLSLEFRF